MKRFCKPNLSVFPISLAAIAALVILAGFVATTLTYVSHRSPQSERMLAVNNTVQQQLANVETAAESVTDAVACIATDLQGMENDVNSCRDTIKSGKDELRWYIKKSQDRLVNIDIEIRTIRDRIRLHRKVVDQNFTDLAQATRTIISKSTNRSRPRHLLDSINRLLEENINLNNTYEDLIEREQRLEARIDESRNIIDRMDVLLVEAEELEREIDETMRKLESVKGFPGRDKELARLDVEKRRLSGELNSMLNSL